MREKNFILDNLKNILMSQNASEMEIEKAKKEVSEGLFIINNAGNCDCEPIPLTAFPISYCPKCGFIFPY